MTDTKDKSIISEPMIIDYLRKNPGFFDRNSEILADIPLTDKKLDDKVIDMQHFMVDKLQGSVKNLRHKYNSLVSACYDNSLVQKQISQAILSLMKVNNLGQLIEALDVDVMHLFDVDVVRIAIETNVEQFNSQQDTSHVIVPIKSGDSDLVMGKDKRVLLVGDTSKESVACFTRIFGGFETLAISSAFIKINIGEGEDGGKGIIAFGNRKPEFFRPEQATDLLAFLGDIIGFQLDKCLKMEIPA